MAISGVVYFRVKSPRQNDDVCLFVLCLTELYDAAESCGVERDQPVSSSPGLVGRDETKTDAFLGRQEPLVRRARMQKDVLRTREHASTSAPETWPKDSKL